VSQYQKGKTNLDFTEARESEWQWHQLGHMQVFTRSRQITMAAHHDSSFFYKPDVLPAAQPQCQSIEGNMITKMKKNFSKIQFSQLVVIC